MALIDIVLVSEYHINLRTFEDLHIRYLNRSNNDNNSLIVN
jgi:hypothetical protein